MHIGDGTKQCRDNIVSESKSAYLKFDANPTCLYNGLVSHSFRVRGSQHVVSNWKCDLFKLNSKYIVEGLPRVDYAKLYLR